MIEVILKWERIQKPLHLFVNNIILMLNASIKPPFPLTYVDDPLLGLGGSPLHAGLGLLSCGDHSILCHGEAFLQNIHVILLLPSSLFFLCLLPLVLLLLLLVWAVPSFCSWMREMEGEIARESRIK